MLCPEVDGLYVIEHHVDALCAKYLLEAHLYGFWLGPPSRNLMQLGHQGMKGFLVDNRYLDIRVLAKMLLEYLARPNATITTAQNQNLLHIGHIISLRHYRLVNC